MSKSYRISEFSDEDLETAKMFIKKAILGWIVVTIDEKVEEWVEGLWDIPFGGEDDFNLNLTITTMGNDLLAAIGAAKNERELTNKET